MPGLNGVICALDRQQICCCSMYNGYGHDRLDLWNKVTLSDLTGLYAYFFPNLAIGQPSNYMKFFKTEIYLGRIVFLYLSSGFQYKLYWHSTDGCLWPGLVTDLQSQIFNPPCSYLLQPLPLVRAWTLLITGFLCLFSDQRHRQCLINFVYLWPKVPVP